MLVFETPFLPRPLQANRSCDELKLMEMQEGLGSDAAEEPDTVVGFATSAGLDALDDDLQVTAPVAPLGVGTTPELDASEDRPGMVTVFTLSSVSDVVDNDEVCMPFGEVD